MKNASKNIRTVYKNALAGITYNGKSVPVYEDIPVQTVPDYFIQIGSIDEGNTENDARFIREVNITIDIVVRQYRYQSRDAVDTISLSVTNAILPNVGGALTDGDFQIGHVQLRNSLYLNGTEGEYYITRKILTFNQTLIQF